VQLFCFPYAGGTADFFNQLAPWFSPSVEMEKLEYAGHGTRRREPFYQDFSQLADDLYNAVSRLYQLGGDYALFGYSMGSIAAVEVLVRIIQNKELPPPKHVFLAAHEPFDKRELMHFHGDEADEWIQKRTISFGGIPEKLQKNRTFWRLYLPLYRADYTLIANYNFSKLTLACEIPLTAFYGKQDVFSEDMEAWRKYFHGECEFVEFPGGHFFITEHRQKLAEEIEKRLEKEG